VILPKLANVFVVLYGVNLLLGNGGPVNRSLLGRGLTSAPVRLTHNLAGVLIGETYLILPYAVLVLVVAFDRVDPTLTAAARGLGAGPLTAFRRVTLPLVSAAVLTGVVIAFILSVNEFVLAVFLSTPETRTLPAALWPEARYKETSLLAAASRLSALVAAAGIGLAAWLLRGRSARP
jgi:ABC-type Fe3+ transport system permease subunit